MTELLVVLKALESVGPIGLAAAAGYLFLENRGVIRSKRIPISSPLNGELVALTMSVSGLTESVGGLIEWANQHAREGAEHFGQNSLDHKMLGEALTQLTTATRQTGEEVRDVDRFVREKLG